jgi:hypothetical protein
MDIFHVAEFAAHGEGAGVERGEIGAARDHNLAERDGARAAQPSSAMRAGWFNEA